MTAMETMASAKASPVAAAEPMTAAAKAAAVTAATRSGGGGEGELPIPEIDRAAAAAAAAAELPLVGVTAVLWMDWGLLAIAGDVMAAAAGERGTPFG
jgi:hypothetical protein